MATALAAVALFVTMASMILLDPGPDPKGGVLMANIDSGAKFIMQAIIFPLLSLMGIGLGTVVKDMGKNTAKPRAWLAVAISIWSMHALFVGWGLALLIQMLMK